MASISIKNIAQAIYESSKDKDGDVLNTIIEQSALFIKEKNLLGKKEEILKTLEEIINKKEGIIKTIISSSKKIDKDKEKDIEDFIKKKYKAKEVLLEYHLDEKLIGGIKIQVGNDIIDTTLSNRIGQLQNYLITN